MSKGGYWVPAEIEDEIIKYSYERHGPIKLKGTSYLYCKYCGLLYLKNSITRWCIRMGCNNEYHRDYKRILNKKWQR
jgi:hypothetical protein